MRTLKGVRKVKDVGGVRGVQLSSVTISTILTSSTPVAVAVSGGADSLALALLLKEQGADCIALTVDHGLRKESAAEAKQVGRILQKQKIPQVILTVKAKPAGNIMEWARRQRYRLMLDYCRQHKIKNLFIAHHQDDQVETFFLNLERGSGLKGLSGMQEVSVMENIRIIRPLLQVPKSALVAYVKAKKIKYIDDPTNRNAAFKRNRLRQAMEQVFPENPALPNRITQAMAHLAQAEHFIAQAAEEAQTRLLHVDAKNNIAELDDAAFRALPNLLQYRVLLAALQRVSPQPKPPRAEALLALLERIAEGEKAFTLHGVKASRVKGKWRFAREEKKAARGLKSC